MRPGLDRHVSPARLADMSAVGLAKEEASWHRRKASLYLKSEKVGRTLWVSRSYGTYTESQMRPI